MPTTNFFLRGGGAVTNATTNFEQNQFDNRQGIGKIKKTETKKKRRAKKNKCCAMEGEGYRIVPPKTTIP